MADSPDYPRPSLTVDVVLVAGDPGARNVLLVRRAAPPFEGRWSLPGGFVEEYEPVPVAAARELAEETGIELASPPDRVVGVYGESGRDPRGWTVSAVYLVDLGSGADVPEPRGGDDVAEARFWALEDLPQLAFDHARIVAEARALLG